MAPVYQLNDTIGCVFVGNLLTTALWGATCMQVYFYCMNYWNRDHALTRTLVMAVLFFDTLHQVLLSVASYDYSIRNWGNLEYITALPWTLIVEIAPSAVVIFLSQGFMISRIYRLSKTQNNAFYLRIVIGALFLSITSELVVLMVWVVKGMSYDSIYDLKETRMLALTSDAIGAANDVIIASVMTLILQTSKTGFKESTSMINKCIIYSMNCGSLTALVAIIALITIEISQDTLIYAIFFWICGKLYANSFLAILNVRNHIRGHGAQNASGMITIPQNQNQGGTLEDQRQLKGKSLAIKIDRETMQYGEEEIQMQDMKDRGSTGEP